MNTCPHPLEHRTTEEVEVDSAGSGEHSTYKTRIYICGLCGEQMDGIPDMDAAEDRAEMEMDQDR